MRRFVRRFVRRFEQGTYPEGFSIIFEPFDERMPNVPDPIMQARAAGIRAQSAELSKGSVAETPGG